MNNPEWFSERDQEGSPLSVTSSGDKMRLGRATQMSLTRELHFPDSIFWLLSTPPLLGSEETKNRGSLRRRWLMTQATHSFLTKNPIQIGKLETWARWGDWNSSYNICFLGNIRAYKHLITMVLWGLSVRLVQRGNAWVCVLLAKFRPCCKKTKSSWIMFITASHIISANNNHSFNHFYLYSTPFQTSYFANILTIYLDCGPKVCFTCRVLHYIPPDI